uniref:Mitochondrial import receptor subunit TOM22 homolog n=2 Tax=Amblyomma TaxID=6942 RepID=G3MTR2_AMBMU
MPADEGDSGIEATSLPESRETSPKMSKRDLDVAVPSTSSATEGGPSVDDDFDLDETLSERLWGLTEMFHPKVRQGVYDLLHFSWGSVRGLYGFGRSAMWVVFSSSVILFAPVIFELERLQMDELNRQQQRQILLGPSAAVSGGAPPGMMPPMGPGQQPRR